MLPIRRNGKRCVEKASAREELDVASSSKLEESDFRRRALHRNFGKVRNGTFEQRRFKLQERDCGELRGRCVDVQLVSKKRLDALSIRIGGPVLDEPKKIRLRVFERPDKRQHFDMHDRIRFDKAQSAKGRFSVAPKPERVELDALHPEVVGLLQMIEQLGVFEARDQHAYGFAFVTVRQKSVWSSYLVGSATPARSNASRRSTHVLHRPQWIRFPR